MCNLCSTDRGPWSGFENCCLACGTEKPVEQARQIVDNGDNVQTVVRDRATWVMFKTLEDGVPFIEPVTFSLLVRISSTAAQTVFGCQVEINENTMVRPVRLIAVS